MSNSRKASQSSKFIFEEQKKGSRKNTKLDDDFGIKNDELQNIDIPDESYHEDHKVININPKAFIKVHNYEDLKTGHD